MEVIGELQYRGLVVGVFEENCWIVGSRRSGEAICIDPGDEPDKILALARDMGVGIKMIANSHGHADHMLGVAGVQRATGARFVLHAADLELVRHGWQGLAARMGLDVTDPPPEPDGFVRDGESVEVAGVRLRVIGTPGHTPGSVSYYSEGLLFSGDTLFRDSIGRTDFPGGSVGGSSSSSSAPAGVKRSKWSRSSFDARRRTWSGGMLPSVQTSTTSFS